MPYQKDIDAAFDKVNFDFYEAFTQNELIYISQAMEEYAVAYSAQRQKDIDDKQIAINNAATIIQEKIAEGMVARKEIGVLREALEKIAVKKRESLDLGESWYDRLSDAVSIARETLHESIKS